MVIRIKKGKDKKDILSIDRADGTRTWTELSQNTPYHDLAHYVVETTLGYQEGFFGMVAKGIDIQDFDKPNEERGWPIPTESYYAEFMASLIQASVPAMRVDPNYVEALKKGAENMNLPFPELPPIEVLEGMRNETTRLSREWTKLPPGETMELEFSHPSERS